MPITNQTLNNNLYDNLYAQGYKPDPLDSIGKEADVDSADVFRLHFTDDDGEEGNAWVAVVDGELVLWADNDFINMSKYENFNKFWKTWAQKQTLRWKVTNRDRLVGDMKKRTVMKKKEDHLNEGYYPLGKQRSYSDSVPTVKLIIQHTRQLEEGEQRFRNIDKIFVENASGERFLLPTNRPGLARVFARHIAEGGTPYDDKGRHITSLVEDYTKMAGFVRATRGGQFNESALKLVNEGLLHYNDLRMTLQGMASHRGYNNYFESYTPVLNEETDDDVSLNELFVQETLDPRIENVMPILKRLSKNINEMNEVKELEEWAQSITEVEDETTKTLAVPADEMLDEAPGAETLAHNDATEKSNLKAFDLEEDDEANPKSHQAQTTLKHLKKASYGDRADAANIKPGIAGYRDRIDMLQRAEKEGNLKEEDVEEGVVDTLKKVGKKVADYIAPSDEQLLKDLQKRMGIPKHAQHGKPGMAKPNKSVEEDLDADQKRVGQLGPTEKVKNNNIGKLVGANESVELSEMDKSQPSSDRGGESSGNPYAKGSKATPIKAKDAEKDAEKALNKSMDKAHKKDVKEGQDDLDAILRIVRK